MSAVIASVNYGSGFDRGSRTVLLCTVLRIEGIFFCSRLPEVGKRCVVQEVGVSRTFRIAVSRASAV